MSSGVDPAALVAELFTRHAPAVLRFARRRLADDSAAWDVVSETFLTAWRHAHRCPAAVEEQFPWRLAIAGNAVRTAARGQVRQFRLADRVAFQSAPVSGGDPVRH